MGRRRFMASIFNDEPPSKEAKEAIIKRLDKAEARIRKMEEALGMPMSPQERHDMLDMLGFKSEEDMRLYEMNYRLKRIQNRNNPPADFRAAMAVAETVADNKGPSQSPSNLNLVYVHKPMESHLDDLESQLLATELE